MCNFCSSGNLNRREFLGRTLKASGSLSLAMAGGIPVFGSEYFFSSGNPGSDFSQGNLPGLKKEPAKILAAFLYPPADVVIAGKNEDNWAKHNWFTWPGNQFEPEIQENTFKQKINAIAGKHGIVVEFAPAAIYQKHKMDEFIKEAKVHQPDAVLIINFWNSFSDWSYEIAVNSAPAGIIYQPVGSNHQLPPDKLLNTPGIYYIHSIENWDEIERSLLAVRAKKMLYQSRLLRIANQEKSAEKNVSENFGFEIKEISTDEFTDLFDSIKPDNKLLNEAKAFKNKAYSVIDVDDNYFTEAFRAHYTVNRIMEKYGADAITIQCLFLKHRKPCISFAINNGNLIPCGCENHLEGTLTLMLGRWLFERAGFMHNPDFDTSENLYYASHCTCATKLQGPEGAEQEYLIRPFFHQLPKTAALDVQWTPGAPVILTKYNSKENSLGCFTGRVIESPKSPPAGGCATRVLVEIDKTDNVCNAYLGRHPVLFMGNRNEARRIKAFAQLYKMKFTGNL